MSKGSTQRPKGLVTDKRLLENWERIFGSKPNNNQFDAILQHKEKVAWRDEMVQEAHDEAIRKGEEHGNT